MTKKNSITKEQKEQLERIAKKFGLELIILFGSFAVSKNRDDSDMDIAVSSEKELSFQRQISLINALTAIFRTEVDLSILNKANPLLLFQISEKAILLFGTSEDFFKFKLRAFRMYHDYAPYFQIERRVNKKIIDAYADR
jgi:predicted nucleotidyltransferase